MNKSQENLHKHGSRLWLLFLSFMVLISCCSFPFSNELFPFSLINGLSIIVSYSIIGAGLTRLLNKGKSFLVFVLTFIFTGVGLVCRYLIEYGEVSNTINFTPVNVILFLIIIPVYCMIVFWSVHKFHTK